MEEEEFFCSGIIPAKSKKIEYLKECMLSIVEKIEEDLMDNFSDETNTDFYVYLKYSDKERILKVFATLNKLTKSNIHSKDIDFVIIVNEEFPKLPPHVYCLTSVNKIIIYII